MLRGRIEATRERKHMPTPDNPDEFYLLLALVSALLPLQWYLGRKLHRKSAAGTSLFHCVFAISNAQFHQIKENETDEFKAALNAYKRTYLYVMIPVLAVIFAVYIWIKAGSPLPQ
jgi:hypothetical protein